MTTSNTGSQLLAEIAAKPEDDTIRLAFADWLEENGDDRRAAFIRGMIDLEKCHPSCGVGNVCRGTAVLPPKVTCAGVRDRVTELFDSNLCRWESGVVIPDCAYRLPWRGTGDTAPVMAIFRRGFVDEVRLNAAAFTEDFARELFARHPVTRVVLTDREPQQWLPEIRGLPPGCANRWFWSVRGPDSSVPGYPHYVPRGVQWSAVWLRAKWYCDTPTYDTADAANAALSDACVAWGRSLAGLPPLPHASGGA